MRRIHKSNNQIRITIPIDFSRKHSLKEFSTVIFEEVQAKNPDEAVLLLTFRKAPKKIYTQEELNNMLEGNKK